MLVIAMMSLNYKLRKHTRFYKFTKSLEKIYHLIYMDVITLCEKMKKESDTDTKNKNVLPGYRNGMWHRKLILSAYDEKGEKTTERRVQPNQERIRTQMNTMKLTEMKEKTKKKVNFRRRRKPSETKLCEGNFIKGINTWAVSFVRYSRPFLKWSLESV